MDNVSGKIKPTRKYWIEILEFRKIAGTKNAFDGLISNLETAWCRIREFENRLTEITGN